MRLRQARIRGFQSFSDSGIFFFDDGVNLVVGQNNSGKSSVLKALLPSLPDDRHRNEELWDINRIAAPQINMIVELTGRELADAAFQFGEVLVPLPSSQPTLDYLDSIINDELLSINILYQPHTSFISDYPSHALFEDDGTSNRSSARIRNNLGKLYFYISPTPTDNIPSVIYNMWHYYVFYFSAERVSLGEAPQQYSNRLTPNASNLPNVLQVLYGDRPDLFRKLVTHLRDIFPSVGNLSVRIKPENNYVEIRVFPTERQERVEHSFPLNSSGTGVSQVIAILTAIMTIDKAIFIIDEINNFLHPAATKALLRIIQTHYYHHQYIISTHSAEVISMSNPKTLYLVKKMGMNRA